MIKDLLKNFNLDNETTLETTNLTIKDNALTTANNSIQIHNISMISRNQAKSPVTLKNILIAIGLVLFSLPFPPLFILAILFIFGLYTQHKSYLKLKYYITFNLGSSQNYYLYFENQNFRNDVYDIVIKSFNTNKQSIYIDLKNQEIQNQTNVSGTDNVVSLNGDAVKNANVIKDATISNSNVNQNIDWNSLTEEIRATLADNNNSNESKTLLNELLTITKEQNEQKLVNKIKDNEPFFTSFVKDIASGTLSGVITSILTRIK